MRTARRGFSLVELVLVVAIIGVLAGIAVPRMSKATQRSSASALAASITNVRKAIDTYYAEHGRYPGYDVASGLPSNASFLKQLLRYTDAAGNSTQTYGYPFLFGPYLRSPFPVNPTNGLSNVYVKAAPSDADPAADSVGWVAVLSHGYFGISANDVALSGIGVDIQGDRDGARGGASLN